MPFVVHDPRAGDIISLDNPKAGSLVMSTSLANYANGTSDPVKMFAYRDAFRAVTEAKAAALGALPFNLYRKDPVAGRQKLEPADHKIAAALDEPSPGRTPYRWIEFSSIDRIMHDRWATWMRINPDGSIRFTRLPARFVSFVVDQFRDIQGAVVWGSRGEPSPMIPIDQLLFDVAYDPFAVGALDEGYSISNTLLAAATELERGAAYRAALLAAGPKVPMFISRPKDAPEWLKNGGRERFIKTFSAYNSERAGEVPILEDGMELKEAPMLDGNAVDYRASRLAAQVEISIGMHFPPELIGYRQGTNSNLETLREQLYIDVLGSDITAFRQAINAGVRRAGYITPDLYIEENIGARLASTPEKQASLLQTQVGAPVRTRNEARAMLNLGEVPGGDELITPLNVVAGGLASPTDTAPKPGDPPGGAEGAANADKAELLFLIKAVTEAGFKAVSTAQRSRFKGDLKAALGKQADRVKAGLGDDSSPGSLADTFDHAAEDKKLHAVIYPHSVAIAEAGAASVLAKYNPTSDGFSNDVMHPWLDKAAKSIATGMNAGTFGALAAAIGGDDWKAGVAGVLEHLVGAGADLWADNVSQTSSEFGAHDAAKASGLGQKVWRWNPGTSGNGRSEHEAMDGETVSIDDVFSNGGRYPGDPVLDADENAQCQCTTEYIPGTPE